MFKRLSSRIVISKLVQEAILSRKPIVALESTIITHGMPFPQNLETALEVENIVKSQGCVPATVAILDGKLKVGLTYQELEVLAKTGLKAVKTSRRDLPVVLAQKSVGSTTVSATLFAAHSAGIPIFVTGGLGGVHRGAEETMDISSDLTELGKTPVTVICAGVKAILDIGKTLEYLETQGVTVGTLGETNDFPAFYTRTSGFSSPFKFKDINECVEAIKAHKELNVSSGIVVACPIPVSDEFPDPELLNRVIKEAVTEAKESGITGKEVTPFILQKVGNITKGQSLASNIALVKNNALLGSQIAKSLMESITQPLSGSYSSRPLIFGGSTVDTISTMGDEVDEQNWMHSSEPGTISQSVGGVARNIAEACHRTGGKPLFWSVVGKDLFGQTILNHCESIGMESRITSLDQNTAAYSAMCHQKKGLLGAVADMDILENLNQPELLTFIREQKPKLVCTDANPPGEFLVQLLETCRETGTPFVFEPVSDEKCTKLFEHGAKPYDCSLATPNNYELKQMLGPILDLIGDEDDDLINKVKDSTAT